MRRAGLLVTMMVGALMAGDLAAGVFVLTRPNGSQLITNTPDRRTFKPFTASSTKTMTGVPSGSSQRRSLLWSTVEEAARAQGLDPKLVDLIIRMESGYNPSALSNKGARGMMQLLPGTASQYGVTNLFDPKENIKAGVGYLRDMLQRFNSDVGLALAAYNAGPEAVERHGGVPPYRETQNYVASILSAYNGQAPARLLGGGFGRKPGRPVVLSTEGDQALISNATAKGEAPLKRRLVLR